MGKLKRVNRMSNRQRASDLSRAPSATSLAEAAHREFGMRDPDDVYRGFQMRDEDWAYDPARFYKQLTPQSQFKSDLAIWYHTLTGEAPEDAGSFNDRER